MKSFKVRDGKVVVDGVIYGPTPTESSIMGKSGRIQSIHIQGKGQFFPYSGTFNDGSLPVVDETPIKKGKVSKTELVEKSSKAVGIDGKPIKKVKTTKKK